MRVQPAAPEPKAHSPYRVAFVLTMQGSLHRFTLLRRFMERQVQLTSQWIPVYTWKERDPLRVLPAGWASRIRSLLEAKAVFFDRKLDAVVFHAYAPFVVYTWYRWLFRRTAISIWYKDDPPIRDPEFLARGGFSVPTGWKARVRDALLRATFARADLVIGRCAYTQQLLVERCGVPPTRAYAIHIGLDFQHWPQLNRARRDPQVRAKLLFVGSQFWRKGGDMLLEVFRDHLANCCELHIVSPDPLAAHVVSQRVPPQKRTHIVLHSELDAESEELKQLYRDADIFVLPTRLDFAPFAVLEAMASGLPVVSTRLGGIPELVEDGVTGWLIDPSSVSALHEALQQLVDDPDTCLKMGVTARERVEASYDAETNIRCLAGLIARAVARHRGEMVT
jgi:glycosyltransferase involved in cell wall biosynthesis